MSLGHGLTRAAFRRRALAMIAGGAALAAWSTPAVGALEVRQRGALLKICSEARPAVQAIKDYQEECGLLPCALEDLVPRHLAQLPPDWTYAWRPDGRCVLRTERRLEGEETPVVLAYVCFGVDRGWYAKQDGRFLVLEDDERPNPPWRPTEAAMEKAEKEFVRRVALAPQDDTQHLLATSFFWQYGELDWAREAALRWAGSFPRERLARVAMHSIERKARFGFDPLDMRSNRFRPDGPKTMAECVLLQTDSFYWGSLDAIDLPFAASKGEWRVVEAAMCRLVDRLSRERDVAKKGDWSEVLRVCERWGQEAEKSPDIADASHYVIRAAAHFSAGDFEAADAQLKRAEAARERVLIAAEHMDALRDAIDRKDASFKFEFWRLLVDGTCHKWPQESH